MGRSAFSKHWVGMGGYFVSRPPCLVLLLLHALDLWVYGDCRKAEARFCYSCQTGCGGGLMFGHSCELWERRVAVREYNPWGERGACLTKGYQR